VERFLVVHGQILLNQIRLFPKQAVQRSAFVGALKERMATRRHFKLYAAPKARLHLRAGVNRNPMKVGGEGGGRAGGEGMDGEGGRGRGVEATARGPEEGGGEGRGSQGEPLKCRKGLYCVDRFELTQTGPCPTSTLTHTLAATTTTTT
jgi:hypothetical protein